MNALLQDLTRRPDENHWTWHGRHWRYRYLCAKVVHAQLLESMLQQARCEIARNVRSLSKEKFEKLSQLIKRFEPQ